MKMILLLALLAVVCTGCVTKKYEYCPDPIYWTICMANETREYPMNEQDAQTFKRIVGLK